MTKSDTIAAIATSMTNSGIGIIRISGEEAFLLRIRYFSRKILKKNYQNKIRIPFIMEILWMGKRYWMK